MQLDFLDTALELLSEAKSSSLTIILVGDQNRTGEVRGKKHGFNIIRWEELLEGGAKAAPPANLKPAGESPTIIKH